MQPFVHETLKTQTLTELFSKPSFKSGALVIGTGFGGTLYCNYNKESPKPYSNYEGPCIPKSLIVPLWYPLKEPFERNL